MDSMKIEKKLFPKVKIARIAGFLLFLGSFPLDSLAQTPNWAQHVAPILYNKCTSCHHSGGIAPFPLMNYSDAQSWASFIKTDVQSGKMPPWPPDSSYNHYVHERSLSTEQ